MAVEPQIALVSARPGQAVPAQQVAREADLPDLIRFALGTGLRIGEVCGVRIGDLDLDGVPVISGDDIRLVPIVAVRGKVYGIRGRGLVRSDTGKTSSALRIIPLPGFVTDRLRARLTGEEDPSIGSCPSAPPVRASKLATQAMEVASVTVGAAGHGGGAPLWFPTDAVSR